MLFVNTIADIVHRACHDNQVGQWASCFCLGMLGFRGCSNLLLFLQ